MSRYHTITRRARVGVLFMTFFALAACGQSSSTPVAGDTPQPGLSAAPQLSSDTVTINDAFSVDVPVNDDTRVVLVSLLDSDDPEQNQLQAVGVIELEETHAETVSVVVDTAIYAKPGVYIPIITTCTDLLTCDNGVVYEPAAKGAVYYSKSTLRNGKADKASQRKTDFAINTIEIKVPK